METILKKPEIFRDSMGRFDRHGKTLAKTQKKTGLINKKPNLEIQSFPERHPDGRLKNGGARPGAGRPKGAQNKIPLALKEMILRALDKLGGEDYLVTLGVENSSAFASLVGKVLPTTLAPDLSGGAGKTIITFKRIIVNPEPRVIEHAPAPPQIEAAPSLDATYTRHTEEE